MHNMVGTAAFAGLLLASMLVYRSHPELYGTGQIFVVVLMAISALAGLCLSPGFGCLAVFLFWCSLATLALYRDPGVVAVRPAIMLCTIHILFLLIVYAGRGFAKLIEEALVADAANKAARRAGDVDDPTTGLSGSPS